MSPCTLNVQLYLVHVFIEKNSEYINSFTGRNKKELEPVQQVQNDAFHSKQMSLRITKGI